MATQERIELLTESSAPVVTIDGVEYAMIDPGDMLTLQLNRTQRLTNRYAELCRIDEPTEEQAKELDDVLDRLFKAVLPDVPDEIAAKLGGTKKRKVAQLFFRVLVAAASDQTQKPSGASPFSSDSTGAA